MAFDGSFKSMTCAWEFVKAGQRASPAPFGSPVLAKSTQ
jgi:hypothetical protein